MWLKTVQVSCSYIAVWSASVLSLLIHVNIFSTRSFSILNDFIQGIINGYEEDIAGDRERRRRRPNDDDNDDVDIEKKREMRRKQRDIPAAMEEKMPNGQAPVEKPAPVEEKTPEPKKESPVIIFPEKPVVDLSKPMTLRERRRLKEQGLL